MFTTNIGELDGNRWEDFCQKCFKLKYESESYQPIPAISGGDHGIEGFTRTGIVFQCYCPDNNSDSTTLYEHQRDKITKDLKKLITYEKQLEKYLGDVKIKKWIFVTPEVNNKDIVKHCVSKAKEYRDKKISLLSNDFDVLIYDLRDFATEIPKILYSANTQIDYIPDVIDPNTKREWYDSSISLIQNANTKNRKLLGNVDNVETKIDTLTNINVEETLKGNSIVLRWREYFPSEYEKFIRVVNTIENDVVRECMFPANNNMERYNGFKNLVYDKLKLSFPMLSDITLTNLRDKVVSGWILDCPINFE